jgi:hypothetical protein
MRPPWQAGAEELVDGVEEGLEDVGAPDRHADGELGGGRETSHHPGRRRS